MKKQLFWALLLLSAGGVAAATLVALFLTAGQLAADPAALLLSWLPSLLLLLAGLACLALLFSHQMVERLRSRLNLLDPENPAPLPEELAPLRARLDAYNRRVYARMSEADRRRSELDTVTAHMQEGMIVLNNRAEILACNRSARALFTLAEGGVPKSVLALRATDGFRGAVRAALRGENGYDTMEQEGKHYSILSTPVLREGRIAGAVLMILDITEKEERERLRREFTANVSHELKTPLTSISGFAELIAGGLTDPDDTRRFAGNIYREAGRLITLVGDIIRLSQLDGGEILFEDTPIDLLCAAREVGERLAPVAERQGITLSVSGVPAYIRGSMQTVELMIYNLAENAIQYNRPDGRVEISVEARPGGACLTVRDTGIGIPAEAQPRIFERFFRVDKSHSKENGGTGLGLSIVKHAAACHGADVSLESRMGEGTAVTICFPPCSSDTI